MTVIESLPSRRLTSDEVETLSEGSQIEQIISVRGRYTPNGTLAFQLIINLNGLRLVATHFDGSAWQIAFDSANHPESGQGRELYERAHEALATLAPPVSEFRQNYFEQTLPGHNPHEEIR